jgi:hypothetical protein
MLSFSELGGTDLHWEVDSSPVIPVAGDLRYALFRGSEAVVTAQCKWEKLLFFDVTLEAGEGTYFVHMDLTASPLQAVVWKAGTSLSAAGFTLTAWSTSLFAGTIATAGGRVLTWRPKTLLGLPTIKGVLEAADGSILLSIAPKTGSATSGKMRISAALAADPDRAALIALAFALCTEQALYLHLAPGLARDAKRGAGISHLLHVPRPNEALGPMGPVTTGRLGQVILALLLASFFLWIFSITLEAIDITLLAAVLFGLSVWTKFDRRRRTTASGAQPR